MTSLPRRPPPETKAASSRYLAERVVRVRFIDPVFAHLARDRDVSRRRPGGSLQVAPDHSARSGLNVALPLAGTISRTVTDAASGLGLAGICAYAVDVTAHGLRAYSAPPADITLVELESRALRSAC
jgi:hypothetical protein